MRIFLAALAAVMLTACGGSDQSQRASATGPSGERLFSQCAVCHTAAAPGTPGAKLRLVGPPLWGVVGRKAAALPEFRYSRALQQSGLVWDAATLDAFIENPHKLVPGTLMSYAGESDAARRGALIAYLEALK